jgi:hypothetical protein
MNKLLSVRIARIFLLFAGIIGCSRQFYPLRAEEPVRKDIVFLSSVALEGRKPGGSGDSLAAFYIRERFRESGLDLLFSKGFQPFSLVAGVSLGETNLLSYNDRKFEVSTDFLPYSFSSVNEFSGEVVFAGYGFDIQSDSLKWNDFENVDVQGRWILILKGDPEISESESKFVPYSDVRTKVLTAIDHGVSGIILTGGPGFSEKDQLENLFYDKNSSIYKIPVIQISRAAADQILASENTSVGVLEKMLNETRRPFSFRIPGTISGRASVVQKIVQSNNVAGILRGNDPFLRDEFVVVGAHYDHLGYGGPGSGSRATDTLAVHPGADDNASGVAVILDLARRFSKERNNRRSLVFVAFGAEETGLIGSRAFVEDSPVDLSKVTAMLNFDMVGRLDSLTHSLGIGGTGTSVEAEEILSRMNKEFSLAFSVEGTGPSDHTSFYMKDIPVLFFSTGSHQEYHTPGDNAERINYKGVDQVAEYAFSVISEIACMNHPLTYREAGTKFRSSRGGRFKVTLGIMPDYAGLENRGLRIDAVTKGKPANQAGLQKGDIITAIDGKSVTNIYDYMNRLKNFSVGQTIAVDFIRQEKQLSLIVRL